MKIVVVIPALDEAPIIGSTVLAVRSALDGAFPSDESRIIVVDNCSTDGTADAARAAGVSGVGVLELDGKGKGLAVREGWRSEAADVYAFMDADLATDLTSLPALVRSVVDGADVALGSRAHPDSVVARSLSRRMLSAGYRLFLAATLGTDVRDLPCGFKAVSPRVVSDIMPAVRDDKWFFDTELVIRAERAGYRLVEIPVSWKEPRKRESKVAVPSVVAQYVRAVARLRKELP